MTVYCGQLFLHLATLDYKSYWLFRMAKPVIIKLVPHQSLLPILQNFKGEFDNHLR